MICLVFLPVDTIRTVIFVHPLFPTKLVTIVKDEKGVVLYGLVETFNFQFPIGYFLYDTLPFTFCQYPVSKIPRIALYAQHI